MIITERGLNKALVPVRKKREKRSNSHSFGLSKEMKIFLNVQLVIIGARQISW